MPMDTRQKNQLLFYLDIVLVGLGSVALVVLVHDVFKVGYWSQVDAAVYGDYLLRASIEAGLFLLSMVYFLARFYRTRVREMANPWG